MLKDYQNLKAALAKGWNTWNTRSVLSHVLLPEGFGVNLGVKEYATGQYLREPLSGGAASGINRCLYGTTSVLK